jgi:hypothetical protein
VRTSTSAALLIGIIGACSANGVAPPGSLKSAVLQYSAGSAQGAPLLAGSLRIVAHDDSTVTGTWAIDWVVGADTSAPVGPQVGSGTLSGRLSADGSIGLDLNPLFADNNVFLDGVVTTAGLAGTWSWSGIAGPIATGRFDAPYAPIP